MVDCDHGKKTSRLPSLRLFNLTSKYFLPLLPYTDLVPPSTDPVPSFINQYRSILTRYHQVSTSTNLYCCCLGIIDSCTVYPGSCYFLSSGCAKGKTKKLKIVLSKFKKKTENRSLEIYFVFSPQTDFC